ELRAANKTNALTAWRARPVFGIGMCPASTAVLSALSAPT
ncbi:amino acid transporter, partial [Xanthomonas oryzae pv. oryzae]